MVLNLPYRILCRNYASPAAPSHGAPGLAQLILTLCHPPHSPHASFLTASPIFVHPRHWTPKPSSKLPTLQWKWTFDENTKTKKTVAFPSFSSFLCGSFASTVWRSHWSPDPGGTSASSVHWSFSSSPDLRALLNFSHPVLPPVSARHHLLKSISRLSTQALQNVCDSLKLTHYAFKLLFLSIPLTLAIPQGLYTLCSQTLT